MDLGQMTAKLRKRIGNLPTNQVSDESLYEHINEAYTYLLDRFDHLANKEWFSFVTVNGVTNYAIPGNFGVILKVIIPSFKSKLTKVTEKQVHLLSNQAISRPRFYAHFDPFITLFPTPDRAYALAVYAKVKNSALVEPTDVPDIDSTWHDGIVKRARFEYYDATGDVGKAQSAMASFNEWIATKPTVEAEETVDLELGIRAPMLEQYAQFNRGFSQFTPDNNWLNERYPE